MNKKEYELELQDVIEEIDAIEARIEMLNEELDKTEGYEVEEIKKEIDWLEKELDTLYERKAHIENILEDL